jgi:hypothetical protein
VSSIREKEAHAARSQLQKEHEDATDYIIQLEEKVYRANRTALEVLK